MNRLRQHQDVRPTKPTVRESLPQRVRCEQLERRPCAHQEGHGENSPALGTPVRSRNEHFPSAKASDEATEALQHFLCDACNRLQQPPARRQVAITHVEMVNDVVSMDVCELPEVGGTQQQREANVDRSEHCGRSIANILKSKSDISHVVEDFHAQSASMGWYAETSRGSFVKPKDVESLWTLFPLAHGTSRDIFA